jgi:hypothetical protein
MRWILTAGFDLLTLLIGWAATHQHHAEKLVNSSSYDVSMTLGELILGSPSVISPIAFQHDF